jgi:hypothetical protein
MLLWSSRNSSALFGSHLLQVTRLATQDLHLVGRGARACFQKLLRPTVIQALGDTLTTTKSGNALLATQAFQHDPDFVLRRVVFARGTPDILDDLLCRWFCGPDSVSSSLL